MRKEGTTVRGNAQQVLRHKSVKASFRATYLATVVMHCALAAGLWWFFRGAHANS